MEVALNNCLESKNRSEMLKKEKENVITDGIDGGDDDDNNKEDELDGEKETNHDDGCDGEVHSDSIVADVDKEMKLAPKGGRGGDATVNGDVKNNGKEEEEDCDDKESTGSKEENLDESSLNEKEPSVGKELESSVDKEEEEEEEAVDEEKRLETIDQNSCDNSKEAESSKKVTGEEPNGEKEAESSDKVEEELSEESTNNGEKPESREDVASGDCATNLKTRSGEVSSENIVKKDNNVAKEVISIGDDEKEASKMDVSNEDDVICESKEDDTNGSNKEQTIIITETKSLAQAINDAVKKPDGKTTLVIIETKTGAATTTTSSSSLSSSSNGVTTVPSKSAISFVGGSSLKRSAPTPTLHSHLTTDLNGGQSRPQQQRQSILQESLLAPTRQLLKPDPGPTVPLPEDAEITVDVPSLVVPYLFECQARETLTHFMKKMGPLETEEEEKTKLDTVPQEPMTTSDLIINSVAQQKTYFDGALGKFFMDIGLTQVQEWVQTEILKAQQRKLAKGWKTSEREKMVTSLKKTLSDSKKKTQQFQFELKKCTRCSFESESQTVLEKHMETIHAVGNKMQCCFCDFDSTEPASIFNHLYVKHRAFARLEKFHNFHMCSLCPFEDVSKSRVTRHSWRCQKGFVPDKNLAPPPDYEPPAKRTRLVASVATLKSMAASAARNSSQAMQQQQHQNASRPPPPIRPKPGELRITPSYVQSVLRSSYVPPPPPSQSRGMSQSSQHSSFARSTGVQDPRIGSPGTLLIPRQQMPASSNSQPYSMQQNQLYQVVHTGSGGVLPVVRGTVGSFHSPPRFTILPTPPATVTTRGPTPVALIPNLANQGSGGVGGSGAFPGHLRATGSSSSQVRSSVTSITNKPNISITPVNKTTSNVRTNTQATSSAIARSMQQQQQQQGGGGGGSGNPSYVVCEICDGYIKDLDQLRNHMQWIHKVKIHPKMIHNRPPLNCQKCHYRFFTDQGLERHLLGSHGLVTSSMQENANKGKDGGRCIICGKVFLWKLVVHMAKDHKMTLKPAHLSYKCTVCSATFNMYRLFETHVYEEHSTVAKRVLDTPKGGGDKSKSSSSSTKDVVTVRSIPSSLAGNASKGGMASKQLVPNSPLRSCIECGIQFQCPSNCIRHMKESHVKPCHVRLCRVDKCVKCTAKKNTKRLPERLAARRELMLDDDDVMVVDKSDCIVLDPPTPTKTAAPTPTTKTAPPTKTVVVFEKKEPDENADVVFDMEVETVDDHSSPGVVHTDVESD